MVSLLLLAALLFPIPHTPTQSDKLTAHILRVYPKCTYARTLADHILLESAVRGLDPAMLAAIAWTESGYRTWVRGSSGEYGLWQLMDGNWLSAPWEEIRGQRPSWRGLGKMGRRGAIMDVRVSTYLAAWLLEYHTGRCGDHRAVCAARYQSGGPRVTGYYVRRLKRRSAIIRGHLDR
jgi:hypothetical protein